MKKLEQLLLLDDLYQDDLCDLKKLEERLFAQDIDSQTLMLLYDYIACLTTVNSRRCKIAFVAGILSDKNDNYM